MPTLQDYAKNLNTYLPKLDEYIKSLVTPIKVKKATQVTASTDALTTSAVIKSEVEEVILATEPVRQPATDYIQVLNDIRQEIDAANVKNIAELSSDNPSMVWSKAQRWAIGCVVDTLDEAIEVYEKLLLPVATTEFYYSWGSAPLDENCKTCKPGRELYSGVAPKSVEECQKLWTVIRKLPGKYLGYKTSLSHLRWIIENTAAMKQLVRQNYDFANAGNYMHRAWNAGEIAKSLLRPIPVNPGENQYG